MTTRPSLLLSTLAVAAGCHGTVDAPPAPVCCSPTCCAVPPSTVECLDQGRCVTTLAAGITSPARLAVDDVSLYWTDAAGESAVRKVPLAGGEPTTLADGKRVAEPYPVPIAVQGTSVYWTNAVGPPTGTVLECAIDGCNDAPTVLASGQSGAYDMAVDSESVYWVASGQATMMKCASDGCNGHPITLWAGPTTDGPSGMALDASNVYWSSDNGTTTIMKCAKEGCGGTPTVLTTVGGLSVIEGIAVDAANVYWTTFVDGSTPGTGASFIQMCSIDGCASPTYVVYGQMDMNGNSAARILVDGENLYWTRGGGHPASS